MSTPLPYFILLEHVTSTHDKLGMKWLKVHEIKQAGTQEWKTVGDGKWMPESGGSSNGGQWLHDTDE